MINDNSQNSKSLSTLTIQDVGVKIKITDSEAIKRWLKNKNIQIHKFPKGNYVYQVDVDCEIDKPFVKDLRNKYPNNWKEIYKKIAKDHSVYEMVVLSLGAEFFDKPLTKIKTINPIEDALFKRYS
ncbi:hypothetical protein SAMN04488062_102245 [Flavobacterium omnivorum]|uniref:Uncharacterized protein n=1 Tax=Flavobacterium omnivorum TaxID=178355 RepID=A0A1G7XBG2_9FLAO|nr:hypothetical protein [Flavobacterium omnivorum]SDG81484.1 hypothetical protein SAMN04488062_102245 [Flavobacterium omnivorum]